MTMPDGYSTPSHETSMTASAATLKALTDAVSDAVARAIASVQREASRAEEVRAAEHRAFMAEARETLAAAMRKLEDKIASVRDGIDGKDGRDGIDGREGEPGSQGERGLPGDHGRDGIDGKDGAPGADGRDGRDGIDGKDGIGIAEALIDSGGELVLTMTDGAVKRLGRVVGRDGADGINGKDGEAGAHGRDGLPGERGEKGEPGENGRDGYAGEARGLYDPEGEYRAMDVVSFNGSEWRAKKDDPGELPGEGWMLSASRGKRGDRGERGPAGAEGKPGATLIAGYVDTQELQMTLTKDDGSEVKVDFYDLADMIRKA